MPFGVTLTYQPEGPPRPRTSRRVALALRLQQLADRATSRLLHLWQGLLLDTHTQGAALGETPVSEPTLLAVVTQTLTQPAQRLLPLLVEDVATQAGTQTVATLGVSLTFQPGTPAVQQAIDAYVGTQITAISASTLEAVRQVLRMGWNTGQPMQTIARDLRAVLGLTPRQATRVQRLGEAWTTEGRTATQVARGMEQATRVGIRQRALMIARTESQRATMLGAQGAMEQAVEAGQADAATVRRFWTVAQDEALCARCAPIPSLNPEGVGLQEPFLTPEDGLVMLPGLHPNCRCVVDYVL